MSANRNYNANDIRHVPYVVATSNSSTVVATARGRKKRGGRDDQWSRQRALWAVVAAVRRETARAVAARARRQGAPQLRGVRVSAAAVVGKDPVPTGARRDLRKLKFEFSWRTMGGTAEGGGRLPVEQEKD